MLIAALVLMEKLYKKVLIRAKEWSLSVDIIIGTEKIPLLLAIV